MTVGEFISGFVNLDELAWVQAISLPMALANERFDAMSARRRLSAFIDEVVGHGFMQGRNGGHRNAFSPALAHDQRQISRVDPSLETGVVDSQQVRSHGTTQYVAEIVFEICPDDRNVAILGIRALRTA